MTLKISGGSWRGRPLRVKGDFRPTESRVREALFSILGESIAGASFADLFAGSGAVGFEALSRGAGFALFVDDERGRVSEIQHNAASLGLRDGRMATRVASLPRELGKLSGDFDFVFLDPPYETSLPASFFAGLAAILAPEGTIIYEHSSRLRPEEVAGLRQIDFRRYGQAGLTFFDLDHGKSAAWLA